MIAYLRGVARSSRILDVDGVGYLVHCPVPLTVGDEIELHVHTQVRDDAITLYGFVDDADKATFEALTKVTGVGPSTALALLAGLGAQRINDAVARKDVKALTTVRGVGAKVAEKIVALVKLPADANTDPRIAEIVNALTGLGFDHRVADGAARAALETQDGERSDADLIAAAVTLAQRTPR